MTDSQWIKDWLANFKKIDEVWLESRRNSRRQQLAGQAAIEQDKLTEALKKTARADVQTFFSEALRFRAFYHSLPDVKRFVQSLKGNNAVDFGSYISSYSRVAFDSLAGKALYFAQGIAEGDTVNIAKGISKNIIEFGRGLSNYQKELLAQGLGPSITAFVAGLGPNAARIPTAMGLIGVNHYPRGMMYSPAYELFERGLGKHLAAFKKALKNQGLDKKYLEDQERMASYAASQDTYDAGY